MAGRAQSATLTYSAADMCGRPANISFIAYYYDPGFMHHLRVDGLGEERRRKPEAVKRAALGTIATPSLSPRLAAAGTRYWYSVGQAGGNRTAPRAFTTALAPGDATPFRFALFGDMALSPWPGAWSTVGDIAWDDAHGDGNESAGGIRFIAHSGDLGYAMGSQIIWGMCVRVAEMLWACGLRLTCLPTPCFQSRWHTIIEPVSGSIPYMV